ncbi:MAG: DUF2924 domain-containing protein [Rhodocyclaceae bacterium]|nr:MAG: DUF2924 domain-containing protein [Rhodocyclaceae bacterium]
MPLGSIDLASLPKLDRPVLLEAWTTAFGSPPPRNVQANFLRSALAWHIQASYTSKAGDFSKIANRLLSAAGSGDVLSSGTRLLREWQGKTHTVTVVPEGFSYQGKVYRSLTAIAREITGMSWSGPKFFGLRP